MEITPEIASLLGSEPGQLKGVEITYKNGGKVVGTLKKVHLNPLKAVIQKTRVEPGERSKHKVVFDHVTQLRVTLSDGTVKTFE